MTIKYLDSKRVSGLAPVSYTTQSAYDTTGTTYGAESNVSASTTRRGIKILTGSSAIGKVIRKVSTKMRGVSSPTGNLTFKVYRSGSAISTSNTLDVSTLTSSFVLKELLLDTKVTLQADDRVVAEYTDATGSMAVHFLYNNSPSTIASGFNHTSWNGSAWSDITYDIMFAFDSTPASYTDTSGDTKPTNVQDNSIFVETDTAKRYWFDAESANTKTVDENFDSTGLLTWTELHDTYISIDSSSNERLDFNLKRDGTNDTAYHQLSSALSDSSWVMDFDITLSTLSQTGGADAICGYIGMASSFEADNSNSHDGMYLQIVESSSINRFQATAQNSQTLVAVAVSGGTQFTTVTPSTTTFYVRLIRNGNDLTVQFFSTSARTGTATEEKTHTVSGIAGLDYITIKNLDFSAGSVGSNAVAGYIDNLKIYDGVTSATIPATWTRELPQALGRAIWASGVSPSTNVIDYITIATLGNATDFGDSLKSGHDGSAVGSILKAVFGGGTGTTTDTKLEYITIRTLSNAVGFGAMTSIGGNSGACGDGSRGIWGQYTTLEYITIDTPATSTTFGALSRSHGSDPASCADATRGVWGGGETSTDLNIIDYVTIQTTGSSTTFGNLTRTSRQFTAVADATRGCFAGGYNGAYLSTIDYITIATLGNATTFGNLTVSRVTSSGGAGDSTRGCYGGGDNGSAKNTIDYITIANSGNATDFGDLTVARSRANGASDYVK
jgi:hypothetical protein